MLHIFRSIRTLLALSCVVVIVAACSSDSAESTTTTTRSILNRTTGLKSLDGTLVGPRGETTAAGIPQDVGAYGKRVSQKGDLVITDDGETITDIDVDGKILVNANDVTIRNFTAHSVTQEPGKTGMTLIDGTIKGNNLGMDGIQWSDFTLKRMDISGSFDGIKAQGNVVIEDSYVHDLYAWKGPEAGVGGYTHNDCVQISIGSNIRIEHNRFENCGFNSAIFIDPDQGKIDNILVRYNYLDSGGFTLYAIASRSANNGIPTNVTITNNVFGENNEFDYATVARGVTFIDNTNTAGNPISARTDDDET
jgi:hypothetical protein